MMILCFVSFHQTAVSSAEDDGVVDVANTHNIGAKGWHPAAHSHLAQIRKQFPDFARDTGSDRKPNNRRGNRRSRQNGRNRGRKRGKGTVSTLLRIGHWIEYVVCIGCAKEDHIS